MTHQQTWWPAIGSGLVLGLVVGIPYYSLPFFYDYFEAPLAQGGFGWSRGAIVLGLPLGTLLTLVLGPLLAKRLAPRTSIVGGALLCGVAVAGFGWMSGRLQEYYALWLLYMAGWTMAGPMNHQVLLSRVFTERRGTALALAFFGISLFGALSVVCLARPLTRAFGPEVALRGIGACVMLAAPIAWLTLPAVAATPDGEPPQPPTPLREIYRQRDFWLLLLGSTSTAAGIAGISQHLKLILRERGFTRQSQLDEVFGWTLLLMLTCSALGRFAFGWSASRMPRRRIISVACLLMLCAIPLLHVATGSAPIVYTFAVLFGLGMSLDTLLVTLLAAERFGVDTMARVLAVLVPVNTVGQTWSPFAVSLLWGIFGNYGLPLAVVFLCILSGRVLFYLVSERHGQSV